MVWRNCGITLQEKLPRLQSRAARIITGDTYEVRSNEIFKQLKLDTLERRRVKQTLSYVTKALSNLCPENISEMFKLSNSDSYNLGSNNNFNLLIFIYDKLHRFQFFTGPCDIYKEGSKKCLKLW